MPIARYRPKTLRQDIPASETSPDEWTSGLGIEFRNGFGWKSQGWDRIFPQPPDSPQWLINVPYQGVNYWFAMTESGVYRTDTSAWIDVTPAGFSGATEPNQWTGGELNGILVFNCANDVDPPYYHDWSDNTSKVLPDFPANTTCRALRPFKFHVFALDVTQNGVRFPDLMLWSDSAAPGNIPSSWTPAPGNDAGDVSLSDTEGSIVDAHIMRGQFYIYKNRSVYVCSYIGGTFVFSFRILFGNVGVLARNCLQEFQGVAYVFADGDIYRHDGQNFRSIIWGRMQRTVFDQIDPVAFQYSFVAEDKANNEMYFAFARTGESLPAIALTYNINTDSLGVRLIGPTAHMQAGVVTEAGSSEAWDDDPDSWDSDNSPWNSSAFNPAEDGVLMAKYTPDTPGNEWITRLDGALTTPDDTELLTLVRKEDEYFERPTEYKLVTRVWPRITYTGEVPDISVRVGYSANDGQAVTWTGPYPFNADVQQWVDCLVQGRYISFQFETVDGPAYSLEGFDCEYELRGQF